MGLARPTRAILRRDHANHQPRLVLAVVGSALAIAADGSLSKPGAAVGPSTIAMLDGYAACMRSHGVSGFPHPSTTETPNSIGIDGYNFDLPSTMNTQSPTYESADKTCQNALGSGGLSAAIVAKARKRALAHAVRMRAHGVPNFPALDALLDAGVRALASVQVKCSDAPLVAIISVQHRRVSDWTAGQKDALKQLGRSLPLGCLAELRLNSQLASAAAL